jgi:hypothetical protein
MTTERYRVIMPNGERWEFAAEEERTPTGSSLRIVGGVTVTAPTLDDLHAEARLRAQDVADRGTEVGDMLRRRIAEDAKRDRRTDALLKLALALFSLILAWMIVFNL